MINQREALTDAFKRREDVPLLVTTEHSVRGVDLKAVDVVFLLGLPTRLDSYVHIAGRTAREGRKGKAVSGSSAPDPLDPFQILSRSLSDPDVLLSSRTR